MPETFTATQTTVLAIDNDAPDGVIDPGDVVTTTVTITNNSTTAVAATGVQFNVLAPGPMRAGLFERHLASAGDPQRFLATREARQPRGRITGVDEVARAALFLLSPASSALLGTTVTADGGLTTGFDFRTGAEGSSAATSGNA